MAQDTLLGFPAHTLPFRCGESTSLSIASVPLSLRTAALLKEFTAFSSASGGIGSVEDLLALLDDRAVAGELRLASEPGHINGSATFRSLTADAALLDQAAGLAVGGSTGRSATSSVRMAPISTIGVKPGLRQSWVAGHVVAVCRCRRTGRGRPPEPCWPPPRRGPAWSARRPGSPWPD